MNKKILLLEDDENLSRGIAFTFEKDGYDVVSVGSIMDGKRMLEQHKIDLIILDLGLPDGNGMDLCKKIRTHSKVPIIMLTACDLETDEVSGLLAGADDYITKPFSLSILGQELKHCYAAQKRKADISSAPANTDWIRTHANFIAVKKKSLSALRIQAACFSYDECRTSAFQRTNPLCSMGQRRKFRG